MFRVCRLAALSLSCLLPLTVGGGTSRGGSTPRLSVGDPGRTGTLTTPAGTSTVNLNNRNWSRVTVEARIGDDPNPEANRSLGSRSLGRGESWAIQSQGEDVWYRRDADPDHPDGRWTAWTHRPCYPSLSETYNENL